SRVRGARPASDAAPSDSCVACGWLICRKTLPENAKAPLNSREEFVRVIQTTYMDLYLIPTRSGQYTVFSPPEVITALDAQSTDRVRQFIEWFAKREHRVLGWVGRGLRSLHDYYRKLEDKIDPVELVLKAMASTN